MDWGIFRPSRSTATCLVLLSIAFLLMTFRLTGVVASFRAFLFYWISPSYETVSEGVRAAGGTSTRFVELILAHDENVRLKRKIRNWPLDEAVLNETRAENERLRALIQLRGALPYKTVAARVSGRDTQDWVGAVWIDRGSDDGIVPDSAVMAVKGDPLDEKPMVSGIIGRVLECGAGSSKVLLISDPVSSVAIALPRTNDQALLQGNGSFELRLEYLDQAAAVREGDEVVTSGLGGIFPAGLPVGRVSRVLGASSGFLKAVIRPAVSLSAAHEVLVLVQEKGGEK